ncbi:vezatin isoform X1 [Chiloscyllium plagiosum]|uniref:vezatin isoform X1 n=1 Tax=Chiloscyllium plagiosum TaxID=36176 RepID=UPI001CB82AF1|nr:vezatin isoform X1 [Chiloscyllium plagiosum]
MAAGEEFDEELVLENSPLYQYLQDVGHTDFEICPTSSWAEECSSNEEPNELDIPATPTESVLQKCVNVLHKWNPFTGTKIIDLESLDIGFRLCTLCTILKQEVLLQEDVELIDLLDPSILQSTQAQQHENGYLPSKWLWRTPNIWDISALAILASALVVTSNHCDTFPWGLVGMGLCGLSLYMVFRSFSLWRTAKLQRSMRKCNSSLEDIVMNSHTFTNLVRKSIRQIQETEVISRGFMLVTAACPASKLGNSRQQQGQQLIGLRRAVYRSVRSAYRASRVATCQMLKSYPLNSEIDNVTNYLSAIPINELGMGLDKDLVSEEEAQELTDCYSLKDLKVLFQLWVGQSSEFFRRLALLLSPVQAASKSHITAEHLAHHVVAEVTQNVPHVLTSCLEELKHSYDFHRYWQVQHLSNLEPSNKTKQQSRELTNVYTVMRSLQLHLKALLNEVISLEDCLEKFHESQEQDKLTQEVYRDLHQKFKLIQPHMEASINCWDETSNLVDKLVHKSLGSKGRPTAQDKNLPPTWKPSAKSVVQIKDQDPVPEEQELEAYVEESDSDGDFRGGLLKYLSQEEQEKERQEREESRRMLQELKSVLGFKASELERQKWKQLLFNDYAALKTVSSADIMQLEGVPLECQEADANVQDHKVRGDSSQGVDANQLDCLMNNQECCRGRGPDCIDVHLDGSKDADPSDTISTSVVSGCLVCCSETADSSIQKQENSQTAASEQLQTAVQQGLAERHGPVVLQFASALAAQVAARSHSFAHLSEQTFEDDDEEEEEEDENIDVECVNSGPP